MPKGVYTRILPSKEIIAKRTEALRKVVQTPGYRERRRKMALEKGYGLWMKGKKHTKETIDKMIKGRFGEKGSSWKGGKWTDKRGYIYIHTGVYSANKKRRYIFEHRFIMEKHLGRKLRKEEVVHHNNGIVNDNRIENLTLFANHSEHMKVHNHGFQKGHGYFPRVKK